MSHYLFCPGPVMIPEPVRKALLHPDMCHRVPSFENVLKNVQRNLLSVFKAHDTHTVLLITGSGTAANETVISSRFTPHDTVLLISNGEFGERLEELLEIHRVNKVVLRYDWGALPDVAEVEARLQELPAITAVMMVFHETSTSVINPVSRVGELAHRYGKTYMVDAISALGGEDVNVARDHIDFCTCSSNKCLSSLPGVGIICARKSEVEKTADNRVRVAYLNLHRLYKMSETLHQTPNTPSVTMFIALDAAVEELLAEGVVQRIERHRRCARLIRDGVRRLGLELLVDDAVASNTVTSVFLPSTVSLGAFIDEMEQRGFTVYPGKGSLKARNMFQIANMGVIDEAMCRLFLDAMKEVLDSLGVPQDK